MGSGTAAYSKFAKTGRDSKELAKACASANERKIDQGIQGGNIFKGVDFFYLCMLCS